MSSSSFSFFSVNNISLLSLTAPSLCSDYDNCQSLSLTEKRCNLSIMFVFVYFYVVGRLHLQLLQCRMCDYDTVGKWFSEPGTD